MGVIVTVQSLLYSATRRRTSRVEGYLNSDYTPVRAEQGISMGKYEYQCEFCYNRLEVERSIHAEASNPSCTNCGIIMSRVYYSPGIQFKGPGFYKTGG